jgi:hypothetical protein
MTNGKSTTARISRQHARKLRLDEALQELERAQKVMTDSERRRRSERATASDEIGLKAKGK